MNLNHTIRPYLLKMRLRGILRSLLYGLTFGAVGAAAAMAGTKLQRELSGGNDVSVAFYLIEMLSVGILLTAVTAVLYYRRNCRASVEAAIREIDALGMQDRVGTMVEYRTDRSTIAQIQREDTNEKLKNFKPAAVPFKMPWKRVIAYGLSAAMIFGMTFWIPKELIVPPIHAQEDEEDEESQKIIDDLEDRLQEIIDEYGDELITYRFVYFDGTVTEVRAYGMEELRYPENTAPVLDETTGEAVLAYCWTLAENEDNTFYEVERDDYEEFRYVYIDGNEIRLWALAVLGPQKQPENTPPVLDESGALVTFYTWQRSATDEYLYEERVGNPGDETVERKQDERSAAEERADALEELAEKLRKEAEEARAEAEALREAAEEAKKAMEEAEQRYLDDPTEENKQAYEEAKKAWEDAEDAAEEAEKRAEAAERLAEAAEKAAEDARKAAEEAKKFAEENPDFTDHQAQREQNVKDDVQKILDNMKEKIDPNESDLQKAAKVQDAEEEMRERFDEEITQDEIGKALEKGDTTKELGEAIASGDKEAVERALDEMRRELDEYKDPEELANAIDEMKKDVDKALEDAGDKDSALREALENFSENLDENAQKARENAEAQKAEEENVREKEEAAKAAEEERREAYNEYRAAEQERGDALRSGDQERIDEAEQKYREAKENYYEAKQESDALSEALHEQKQHNAENDAALREQLDETFEQAKDEIGTALDYEEALKEMEKQAAAEMDKAIRDLGDESEKPEEQGEQEPGEQEEQGEQQPGQQEQQGEQQGEKQKEQQGGEEGKEDEEAEGGSGGEQAGDNFEKVFDPEKGSVSYDVVYDKYYDEVCENRLYDSTIDDEMALIIQAYLTEIGQNLESGEAGQP